MNEIVCRRNPEGSLDLWVDGKAIPVEESLRLVNHSPTGFNAGYGGSRPAQLALAILMQFAPNNAMAIRYHQDFKREKIADENLLHLNKFTLHIDVKSWLVDKMATHHEDWITKGDDNDSES